jgi:hypothetical protein
MTVLAVLAVLALGAGGVPLFGDQGGGAEAEHAERLAPAQAVSGRARSVVGCARAVVGRARGAAGCAHN